MSSKYVDVSLAPLYLNEVGCKMIQRMPLADVQEVRHGEWETPEPDGCLIYDKKAYKQCSNCKAKQFLAKTTDKKMKYCPNCGCKMMGDDN